MSAKAKILIVDADPEKLNVLKAALTHAAYQVASATSASFALTTLERDRPDLIVSGNRTEDMDGVEFCSIIRSDPAIHDIPFLLLSGPKRPTPWAPEHRAAVQARFVRGVYWRPCREQIPGHWLHGDGDGSQRIATLQARALSSDAPGTVARMAVSCLW